MSETSRPAIESWAPDRHRPWWFPLVGAKRHAWWDGQSIRCWWGEFNPRHLGLAVNLYCYEEAGLMLAMGPGRSFIHLPVFTRFLDRGRGSMDNPQFGFSWDWGGDLGGIHLHWGQKTKIIEMPWARQHISTEFLGADLLWHPDTVKVGWRGGSVHPWQSDEPYRYMLDSGEVQTVVATITRDRRTYGLRWFGLGRVSRFLRKVGPKEVFNSIDVQFSEEVGERRGSWKGGCVGCSYNMKPGEAPRNALIRMQRERRFS